MFQDVDKEFPELVEKSGTHLSVNYAGLVPILIEALKELDYLCGLARCELKASDELLEKYDVLVSRYDALHKDLSNLEMMMSVM